MLPWWRTCFSDHFHPNLKSLKDTVQSTGIFEKGWARWFPFWSKTTVNNTQKWLTPLLILCWKWDYMYSLVDNPAHLVKRVDTGVSVRNIFKIYLLLLLQGQSPPFKFIYLFLVSPGLHCCARASLTAVNRGYSPLQRAGCSCCGAWALGRQASVAVACGLWFLGSRAQVQHLWLTGLLAPRHVGFSQIRERNCISCIGRPTLYHWATREAPGTELLILEISCWDTQLVISLT